MRCCREKNSAVLEVMRESTGMVAIKYLRRGRQEVVLGWDAADVLRRRNDSTGPEAQSSGRPVTKETAKIQTCKGQQICGLASSDGMEGGPTFAPAVGGGRG